MTIENAASLVSIFGRWPSFHDAEVLRVVLDREGPEAPYLEATVYVFEATTDLDPQGHYVLKNHTIVTLRFIGIQLERLEGFNQQNVLSSLQISEIDPAMSAGRCFHIGMPSSYGIEAEFDCRRVIVADVRPKMGGVAHAGQSNQERRQRQ